MKVTAEEGLKGLGSRGLRGREGGPGAAMACAGGNPPRQRPEGGLGAEAGEKQVTAVGRGRDEGENWSERCWETEILVVDTPPMKRGDLLRRPCPWPACDCVDQ